jgi:hypothetical protein
MVSNKAGILLLLFLLLATNTKKNYWQRLLIPSNFLKYNFVVSPDTDIFINNNSPPFPLNEIPIINM